MDAFFEKALRLLASESIRQALDITQEPTSVRERYGFGADGLAAGEVNGGGGEMGYARQMRGQNFLLARRPRSTTWPDDRIHWLPENRSRSCSTDEETIPSVLSR